MNGTLWIFSSHLDHVDVRFPHSKMQGGLSVSVCDIHINALIKKQLKIPISRHDS